MKTVRLLIMGLIMLASTAGAQVAPVVIRAPEVKAWIGQRVPFFIELRAQGSFEGTASFELPQLPGALLMKIGNPVVSSQDIAGESRIVQIHEFALFSQKPGRLEVPAIPVHFACREGFTGPATDVRAQAPAWNVEIQRPPGTSNIGFLITTESLDITETWQPQPGTARVGEMFKRTIVQRAPQLSGMALSSSPDTATDGIRVYPGDAETRDQLERGDFIGERRETITYLLQKPGNLTLPALTYAWWNPKTETLESKTLPAVTFVVSPAPVDQKSGKLSAVHLAWPWLLAAALAIGLSTWKRRHIAAWCRHRWKTFNPPDRVAARKLLCACRRHDAAAAVTAWMLWQNVRDAAFQPETELRSAVLELQRYLFGHIPGGYWRGDTLARAFGQYLAAEKARCSDAPDTRLPDLNP